MNVFLLLLGFNGENIISSSEVYDFNLNCWLPIADMPSATSCATASNVGDLIFVMGGWDGFEVLSTAQVYNTKTNKWIKIDDMIIPRKVS